MVKRGTAREKILNAALRVIRSKGYAATSVDELCAAAGVTKGAFFHHFPSKEALAVAAAGHWSETTGELFAAAPYHALPDPLDRVFGYLDFRRELLKGRTPEFTCLVGVMAQEVHVCSPAIRAACERSIWGHARTLESDIEAAMKARGVTGFCARSLALHTQCVIQGAFILAKAKGGPAIAVESVDHLRRYVELLFSTDTKEKSDD
ncbi:TetR/AcrR family transcriptional regulator [Pikeienuella piscinae]|uniref:TetR/AcrR family transcriptional regulator n=1 Tax=Pikeienuella piscinae TaxID=2748098 RepID=A0A7L5C034_9RHOB|nr:TetR/AcrR family transcriptional regulator [Pikeienuella piscinae]QIE55484.1 TetR/AcrR family transcriptional regulator [Pikeienuella piscinae]